MSADIDGIGANWSAKAAAMDSFTRVDHRDAYVALWISQKDDVPRWAVSNMSFADMAALAALLNEMVARRADHVLNPIPGST